MHRYTPYAKTSCASAFVLNYATYLCTQVNDALTTSVVGRTKSVVQGVGGLFAFRVKTARTSTLTLSPHTVKSRLLLDFFFIRASLTTKRLIDRIHDDRVLTATCIPQVSRLLRRANERTPRGTWTTLRDGGGERQRIGAQLSGDMLVRVGALRRRAQEKQREAHRGHRNLERILHDAKRVAAHVVS